MRLSQYHGKIAPGGFEGLLKLEAYIRHCGLEPSLLELVKVRASQLNGCTFCMDMHTTEALQGGESMRRLSTLPGWREAPFFTPRERAALAWTEALTELPRHQVSEALHEETSRWFPELELVNLTYAIAAINAWNRLGVAFQLDLPALEAGL